MSNNIVPTFLSKTIFTLLCGLIVFTALAYGTVHQPIIALFYLLVALAMILWIIDSYRTGVVRFHPTLLQVPLIAVILYALIQIIPFGTLPETGGLAGIPRTISLEPYWTQVFALHFVALLFFFSVLLTYLDSNARLRKMAALITIFGFLFAFFAVLQSFLSSNKIYGIYETQFAQPFGSFVNRHNFASYMEMTMAVPLGLLFAGAVPKDKRLIYLTAIGLMGIALLLSGSRGGLVALLAEIFLLALLTGEMRGFNQVALKIGMAVLLLATIIGGTILIGGESSLTRMAETAGGDNFTTDRTHIWQVTFESIKNNLPLGAGIGAFSAAYTPYDSFNGMEIVEQAHNDYLQVLADAGLIGLLIAAFFIYRLFRTGLKNVKTHDPFRRGLAVGALAGCFGILVHSLFDFVLHTTAISVMFLTLVSLVVTSGGHFADDEKYEVPRRRRTAKITPIGQIRKKESEK